MWQKGVMEVDSGERGIWEVLLWSVYFPVLISMATVYVFPSKDFELF